jgi:bifunctional polynucleotide phosphatase/kinase
MAPTKRPKLEDENAAQESEDEKRPKLNAKWQRDGTLLYLVHPDFKPNAEVFGFDLDSTLIEPEGGRKRKRGRGDWQWLYDDVLPTLKKHHADGKSLVIFSNQNGIAYNGKWDSSKEEMIKGMVFDVIEEAQLPISAFLAAGDDMYRKPQAGMWEYFTKNVAKGKVDLSKSLYVGDAAGRPDGWEPGRKKDFSCSDRKFAKNVGVEFKTPEEFFLGKPPAKFDWGGVDTTKWQFADQITSDGRTTFHSTSQEIIVFCGFPGAGKSTFASRHLVPHGYVHVNRDTLKTPKACYNLAVASVKQGKSVVIDNTMPKFASDDKDRCNGRQAYVQLAKEHKIPIRCFRFAASEDLAKHLNMFREKITNGAHKHVSRIGYNVYKKEFTEPHEKEGYSEVVLINFRPHFEKKDHEDMFYNSTF